MTRHKVCSPLLAAFVLTFALTAHGQDIQIVKIIPQEETATIKLPAGKVRTIKAGDVIKGDELSVVYSVTQTKQKGPDQRQISDMRVLMVSEGRIVFEAVTNKGPEKVIIAIDEKGKQSIARVSRIDPNRTLPSTSRYTGKESSATDRVKAPGSQ